jgi:hypothetical protein
MTALERGETVKVTYTDKCEVYMVKESIWERAGAPDGCLCIACLEKRLGRKLKPKDLPPDESLNLLPATPRLASRMKRRAK